MSAVVRRALPLLKVLADAKPKLKKAIIQHAPTELVTAISEIVLNLIKGVIKLTASQKKRLSRYKKDLLALAKKKLSTGKKKENPCSERWFCSCFNIGTPCAIVIVVKIKMKRMVLIPEERLLRYEERDKQRVEHRDDIMYGGGEEEEETDSLSVEMIVRGIPKTMKSRAEALLAHLKERGDVITWDDMGQVLLDGVLIPKSNISDLVSDAMRSRKHFNPVGVREFYNVLNKINVPKDLVRNEKRWDEAEKKNVNEKTKELTIPEWISF